MVAPWLVIGLAGVAFLYDSSLRDPFLSLRFLFLSSFLLLAMSWFFIYKKWKIQFKQPLTIVFIVSNVIFLAWNIICATQAVNIQESIFVISRQALIFITFLFFYGIFSPKEVTITDIFKALTITLLIQSIIGILQVYNIAFTSLPGDPHPTGFSGNRNLYASFLTLLMPFAFYTLFISNRTWKIISGAAAGLGVLALILGQTRSAWLAFIISVFVFQGLFLIFQKRLSADLRRNWLRVSLAGVVGVALAIGVVFVTDSDGALWGRLKSRLVSLYDFSELEPTNEASRNVNERIQVWKGTLQMIENQPLMGFAPGNWRIHFPTFGGSSALKGDEAKELDKVRIQPHNVYLQTASESGIIGLLLLLLIGLITTLATFQNIIKSKDPNELLLNFLILSGMVAFATDMIFSFPQERVEHSVVLMLMTGILFSRLEWNAASQRKAVSFPVLILIPILIFCIILGNAKRKFDYYTMEAIKYETRNAHVQTLAASEQGKSKLVTLDPVNDPMELHSARAYIGMGNFPKALQEIKTAERFHPNSHRILNTEAVIYIKQQQYKEAIAPLQKSLQLSPDYEPSLRNLAYSYYRTDAYQSSLDVLNKIDITQDTLLQKLATDLKRRIGNEERSNNTDPGH